MAGFDAPRVASMLSLAHIECLHLTATWWLLLKLVSRGHVVLLSYHVHTLLPDSRLEHLEGPLRPTRLANHVGVPYQVQELLGNHRGPLLLLVGVQLSLPEGLWDVQHEEAWVHRVDDLSKWH